jgi:nitrogen fixation protein NifU and related proteins
VTPPTSSVYSRVILARYRHPTFTGTVAGATGAHEGLNPLCGDRVRVEVAVRDGRVAEARFRAEACAICVAAASLLMERVEGRTVDEARAVGVDDVIALLEAEIVPGRRACAALPVNALHAALGGAVPIDVPPT